jgi:hypothetical protein
MNPGIMILLLLSRKLIVVRQFTEPNRSAIFLPRKVLMHNNNMKRPTTHRKAAHTGTSK